MELRDECDAIKRTLKLDENDFCGGIGTIKKLNSTTETLFDDPTINLNGIATDAEILPVAHTLSLGEPLAAFRGNTD